MNEETLFSILEKKCQDFDWFYVMSDCHKTFSFYHEDEKLLRNLISECEKIDLDKTKKTVKKYQSEFIKIYN